MTMTTSLTIVRFDSFLLDPATEALLRAWSATAPGRSVDVVHDALVTVDRADLPAETGPGSGPLPALGPPPVEGRIGATTFVVVTVTDEVGPSTEALATDWLRAVSDDNRGPVQGGTLAPGVGLWTGDDPAWALVLCVGEAGEREAGGRLYGPIRMAELAHHKVRTQFAELLAFRDRLHGHRVALESANAALLERWEAAAPGPSAADPDAVLDETEARSHDMARAFRALSEAVGWTTRVQSSLESNSVNLRRFLDLSGRSPGRSAWANRFQFAELAVEQARNDLQAVAPALEAARWTKDLHQSRLLTALTRAERRENQLRVQAGVRNDDLARRVGYVGVGIALLQVWVGIVQTCLTGPEDLKIWRVVGLMVFPLPLAWLAWCFWPRTVPRPLPTPLQ